MLSILISKYLSILFCFLFVLVKYSICISNLDSLSEEKITNMIAKYLKYKTYVIVTHRPKLKELCNRHYRFENHIMKEIIEVDT